MLLPVFAAKITGNPHYFDVGTTAEKILLYILESCFYQEKLCEMSEVEQKNQLFYKAGILKDDLSNDVLVFGMRGWKYDGTVHEGIEGFFHTGEPVRLTLRTLGKIKKWRRPGKTFIFWKIRRYFLFLQKKIPTALLFA